MDHEPWVKSKNRRNNGSQLSLGVLLSTHHIPKPPDKSHEAGNVRTPRGPMAGKWPSWDAAQVPGKESTPFTIKISSFHTPPSGPASQWVFEQVFKTLWAPHYLPVIRARQSHLATSNGPLHKRTSTNTEHQAYCKRESSLKFHGLYRETTSLAIMQLNQKSTIKKKIVETCFKWIYS